MKLIHLLQAWSRYSNRMEIWKNALLGRQPGRLCLAGGMQITAPPHCDLLTITDDIFFKQVYTHGPVQVEAGDVVVDIGANVGVFSLYAAARTNQRVLSYEPYPENYEFLLCNLRDNRVAHVDTRQAAVTDILGVAQLYIAPRSGGHLMFDHGIKGKLTETVEVPSVTLPSILENETLERIDFLKMDCEGSEGMILRSTPPEMLRRIRKIAMEYHDNVSPLSHEEMQQLLQRNGFQTALRGKEDSPFGMLYAWREA